MKLTLLLRFHLLYNLYFNQSYYVRVYRSFPKVQIGETNLILIHKNTQRSAKAYLLSLQLKLFNLKVRVLQPLNWKRTYEGGFGQVPEDSQARVQLPFPLSMGNFPNTFHPATLPQQSVRTT